MESCGTSISRSYGETGDGGHFTGIDTGDRTSRRGQKCVAIVDDERGIVEIYSHICGMMGLKIAFIAYDGAEALDVFGRSARPDAVLIDHRMPGMTGVEAMRRMLDVDPDLRFIMLSADEVVRDEALDSGAIAFVKKPASLAEIGAALRQALCLP